jgi:von Willebrand factor type D domain
LLFSYSHGTHPDPHFQTYDGTQYSFHGECDLVMARSASFGDNTGLDVHVRTTMVDNWSLISNAAVRIGEDIFEVANTDTHYFNGMSDVEFPITMAGKYSITKSVSDGTIEYIIELINKETINIMNFKQMLSVRVNAHLADTEGMLGRQGMSGMVSRDQQTIFTDAYAMGAEWQVRENEAILFHDIRAPQYPESCRLPDVKSRRLRLNTLVHANEACANVRESMRRFCVEDVMYTGDVTMAKTYSFFNSAEAF